MKLRAARIVNRTAVADVKTIDAYLPTNYAVIFADGLHIVGTDVAGWTLDGYVIPRLASGLIIAEEVTE